MLMIPATVIAWHTRGSCVYSVPRCPALADRRDVTESELETLANEYLVEVRCYDQPGMLERLVCRRLTE
jgi:hypothetical protein